MALRKHKEAVMGGRSHSVAPQPRYHRELGDEYLVALQRQVDGLKPKGFVLTPLSEPGW